MLLFYTPDITGDFYTLNEEESKHCFRVLRLREGDDICLTDGRGTLFYARITEAHPKHCSVEVVDRKTDYEKRNYLISIAVAPTKSNDRMEWFLEKATEIGVDNIYPVLCKHSERKQIKLERFNKVVTSAVKQSLKAYHPNISELERFEDFVSRDFSGDKFIAYCDDWVERKSLKSVYKPGNDAVILIGPEGDFRREEVEIAMEKGFIPVTLGNSRLRTETAAVVACHSINFINEL
ncbi:MAG: 16S rRNA (uracil(1498)-N(3))-methyltransferase [Bacteroidales bacterium]